MRICYISDSAIPSTSPNSIHVMKMCQALAGIGHQVLLIGKKTTACLREVGNVYDFYSVENTFEVQTYPFRAFRGSGLYYNLSFVWRSLMIRGDLLYTRSITAAFFLLLYGKRVAFEVHEPFEGKGFRLRQMFSFVVRHKKLEKLIVISEALRSYYIQTLLVPQHKIVVAHDAADPFTFPSPAITDASFKVGYVGSLFPGKGMEVLMPLARACPHAMFHVVGGSTRQVDALTKESSDLRNLTFHGFKSQKELPAYITSFDVLIAPYTDQVVVSNKRGANNLALWMSPLKIFEYMASGKPIIATSLPVIREVLTHKKNAWLCSVQQLSSWQEAIHEMMRSPDLRERLATQAKADFDLNYTWRRRAAKILQSISENGSYAR